MVSENARVDAMTRRSRRGDLEEVGALLDASHASLRDDYEVSVPEVEATVATLKEAGAAGARIVGGGFGGSVLALLPPDGDRPPGRSRSLRARRRGSCLLALDAQLLGHLLLLGILLLRLDDLLGRQRAQLHPEQEASPRAACRAPSTG